MISALLGGEASDVEEDEGVLASVGGAERVGAMTRVEQVRIHATSPDLDVTNAELLEVGGGGCRRRVGAGGALVEAREVSGDRRAQPADAVRFGVAGEVGVVGGDDRDSLAARHGLSEPPDRELGGAVDEVGAMAVDEPGDGGAVGEGEADVGIEGEGVLGRSRMSSVPARAASGAKASRVPAG